MEVTVLGAKGSIESVETLIDRVRSIEQAHSCTVQIFRADRIFGRLHVQVAVEHAERAFEQGRNRSEHLGTEILLYCAAERQIKNAIELLGVTTETKEMVLLLLGDVPEEEALSALGLKRADEVLNGQKEMTAFQITENEIELVGQGREVEIILERMALSELER